MEMQFGQDRYWTTFFENKTGGFGGYRLHRETDAESDVAAEVIFWDAAGNFTIQTFGRAIQVEVAQALIAEAQAKIQIR